MRLYSYKKLEEYYCSTKGQVSIVLLIRQYTITQAFKQAPPKTVRPVLRPGSEIDSITRVLVL